MNQRAVLIFILTHFYPVFIAGHLYFGDWCRKCQIMFNIVPIIVFSGLLFTWKETSYLKLTTNERFNLNYLIWNLFFIYLYYCLCIFSMPEWVYNHNYQAAGFISITLLFYILNYRERK